MLTSAAQVASLSVIDWRRVPWPLWLYFAGVLPAAVALELGVSGPALALVLFAVLTLAWLYALLRGVRWVWIVTVAVTSLGLLADVISGSMTWQGMILNLVGVALLTLPATRRHFVKQQIV